MSRKWKLKNKSYMIFGSEPFVSYTRVDNNYVIDNVNSDSTNILELFDTLSVGGKVVFNNDYYMRIDEIRSGTAGSPSFNYKSYIINIYNKENVLQHNESSYLSLYYQDNWSSNYCSVCLGEYTISSGGVTTTGDGFFQKSLDIAWYVDNLGETVSSTEYRKHYSGGQSGFIPTILHDNISRRSFWDVLFLLIPNEDNYGGKDIGDPSTTGGQDGNGDDTTDIIPTPEIPTLSLIDCGMVSAYKMTESGLKALSNELWSANSELLENLKKMFLDNPMESIMSLSLIPLNLTGTEGFVKIGNYPTQIGCTVLSEQYIILDCGYIDIELYWGNSLDYDPYTKYDLYLPMIGCMSLSADEITGKRLSVKYIIDIISGSCVAFVSVNNSVLYSASGNCMLKLPISGRDASSLYSSIIQLGASAVPTIATGGALGLTGVVNSGLSVLGNKPHAKHSGTMSGNNGVLNVKYPVLTITRAKQSLPENFYKFKGYTSNITEQIKNLYGYTEVEYIRLENISGITDSELAELEEILKSGFIVK